MGIRAVLILTVLSTTLAQGRELPFTPWPMFAHDASNSGRSGLIGAEVSALKWAADLGAPVTSSPVVAADGAVYIAGQDGRVWCFEPDGSTRWVHETGATIDRSSLALGEDGVVYVTAFGSTGETGLVALNSDGSLRWCFATPTAPLHAPTIGPDGTIYVGTNGSGIFAVNPDGTQRWQYGNWKVFRMAPAVAADGTVYAADMGGRLHAVDPSGLRLWAKNLGGLAADSAATCAAAGEVYVGCADGKLYAFGADGVVRWTLATGGPIYASPALDASGNIFVPSQDGLLYALEPGGAIRWTAPVAYTDGAPVVDYDGKIYVGARAFTPDGATHSSYAPAEPVAGSGAIGPDGTYYIASGSRLLALSAGAVDQPQVRWPNEPPVVSAFASPEAGGEPLLVALRAEASDPDGEVVSYAWDLGDGAVAEGASVEHVYAAGAWTATVTVTDDGGLTASASAIVTVTERVDELPVVEAHAEPVSGPAPLTVTFSGEASDPDGGAIAVRWDTGDDIFIEGLAGTYTYESPGTYTAVLSVTDDEGNLVTGSVVITVEEDDGCRGRRRRWRRQWRRQWRRWWKRWWRRQWKHNK